VYQTACICLRYHWTTSVSFRKGDVMHKMYSDFAAWWPLLSDPADYAEEADVFWPLIRDAGLPASPTLLELGAGGGNTASHLKRHFAAVTLSDLSHRMLAVSRALNPECEHVQGDMRTVRLGQTFDALFVHDAIEYMTTEDDLRAAIETAAIHCKPGGVALFVPDSTRETFQPSTEHGGHDGDGRSMRYMEWTYDPDPSDTCYVTEYIFAFREGAGPAHVEHEQHALGVFSRADWLRLLAAAGFVPSMTGDPFGRDLFVCLRRTEHKRPDNSGAFNDL
jgi:SAM-dependent methyltransferase